MKIFDVLWIEDDSEFVNSTLENFKEDREDLGYSLVPWHFESLSDFNENSAMELSSITMHLVCVDYNLPGGINGDKIIKTIRSSKANGDIKIIFYSAIKTEQELKSLLSSSLTDDMLNNIYYSTKDTIEDQIKYHCES